MGPVLGVHQAVRPGLDLGRPRVEVVRARPAGGDDVATGGVAGGQQHRHRLLDPWRPSWSRRLAHEVALVAHHAAHREPAGAGQVGEAPGVLGVAPAPGHAHVDVDEHLADAAVGRGRHRRRSESTATVTRAPGLDDGAEAAGVEHLVGQQEVVAETGGGHALDLAGGGAAERAVPGRGEAGGERRRLERLDVGTEPAARVARRPWSPRCGRTPRGRPRAAGSARRRAARRGRYRPVATGHGRQYPARTERVATGDGPVETCSGEPGAARTARDRAAAARVTADRTSVRHALRRTAASSWSRGGGSARGCAVATFDDRGRGQAGSRQPARPWRDGRVPEGDDRVTERASAPSVTDDASVGAVVVAALVLGGLRHRCRRPAARRPPGGPERCSRPPTTSSPSPRPTRSPTPTAGTPAATAAPGRTRATTSWPTRACRSSPSSRA